MSTLKNKLIVICGPTGVGKTALAIELAKQYKTEIISADSRQIFSEMNIGTAKPTTLQLAEVQHHFINSHSIDQDYDAAQFGRDALALIHKLFESLDTIIVCGGSGLYIKAICEGFDDIPSVPTEIRHSLVTQFEKHGLPWLQQKMQALDAEHFNSIDNQNPHRLMRALEVRIGTGKSIATFQNKSTVQHPFEIVKIGVTLEREELYQRIDKRMDGMVEEGLFEEAQHLYHTKNKQALQTVGYQEIFDFIDGKYNREEAIRLLKRNSRRYAKRQMTWFKRDEEIKWFTPADFNSIVDWIGG